MKKYSKNNQDGFILLQTLVLFMLFISLFTLKVYAIALAKQNSHLIERAYKRTLIETQAMDYYFKYSPLNNDFTIIDAHWITYLVNNHKVEILIEGELVYKLILELNQDNQIQAISYKLID